MSQTISVSPNSFCIFQLFNFFGEQYLNHIYENKNKGWNSINTTLFFASFQRNSVYKHSYLCTYQYKNCDFKLHLFVGYQQSINFYNCPKVGSSTLNLARHRRCIGASSSTERNFDRAVRYIRGWFKLYENSSLGYAFIVNITAVFGIITKMITSVFFRFFSS